MTIEQRINKLLRHTTFVPVEIWLWKSSPESFHLQWKIDTRGWESLGIIINDVRILKKIDNVIKNSCVTESLTSPSRYIRECKKWFMENK